MCSKPVSLDGVDIHVGVRGHGAAEAWILRSGILNRSLQLVR